MLITMLMGLVTVPGAAAAPGAAVPVRAPQVSSVTGWSTSATSTVVGFPHSVAVRVGTGTQHVIRSVLVQRRKAGGAGWSQVSSALTTPTGELTVSLTPPRVGDWQFRLVVPATASAASVTTPVVWVTGIPGSATSIDGWPTAAVVVAAGAGVSTPVQVRTGGEFVARQVEVQRRGIDATAWSTVTTAATAPDGTYTATLTATAGVWQFRIIVPRSETGRAAATPARQVTVTQTTPPLRRRTITAGEGHTCALDTVGQAWCWGWDWSGQLGDGATSSRERGEADDPVAVAGDRTYAAITAGSYHTCALDPGGRAWCWGRDWEGQVGDAPTNQADKHEPVPVVGDRTFTAVAAGSYHTCALDAAGLAWCWGWDRYGQVGNGTRHQTDSVASPTAVAGGHRFVSLTARSGYTCGVDTDHRTWCWGRGWTGPGAGRASFQPVAAARPAEARPARAHGR